MRYEGSVYRPPSEAYSLIVQVTIGCSHNECIFCSMYKDKKFRLRDKAEVLEDLRSARNQYRNIKRIFLADGNALVMRTEHLKEILQEIRVLFPECERVGIYSAPLDILRKSVDELKELHGLGLGIAYLGVESGSDKVLQFIKKGVDSQQMIEAGRKIMAAGIKLSITLISGIGGQSMRHEHAAESAKVINAINPDYLGLLTLLVQPGTEIHDMIQEGRFELLTPYEVMLETKELIQNLTTKNCIFRSNHASNYFSLEGTLPQDKEKLLRQLDSIIESDRDLKGEQYRRL